MDSMATTVLLAEDDQPSREIYHTVLDDAGYRVIDAADGNTALGLLDTESVDLLLTDVTMPGMTGIQLLEQARQLHPDLRAIVMTGHDVSEAVFRELLNNAIEHGGKCDPTQRVEIKYIHLKRAILYSIKDPGEGFNITDISHAAFANPPDQPTRHMEVRQELGLRPGGFGIMLASQVIDELVYNEKRNELIFVKYIDEQPGS